MLFSKWLFPLGWGVVRFNAIYLFICFLSDQDSTEEVVRVLASKGFTAIQTASGKVRT